MMDTIKSPMVIGLAMAFTACATDAADPAGADEAQREPAAVKPAEPTCVTNVSTHATSCFETFTAAIAHATGGQVTDAPNDAHAYATNVALRERVARPAGLRPATTYVIGIQFKELNYQGTAWVYSGTHACTPLTDLNPEYEVDGPPWLPQTVSSFLAENNCYEVLYARDCRTVLATSREAGTPPYDVGCIRWY